MLPRKVSYYPDIQAPRTDYVSSNIRSQNTMSEIEPTTQVVTRIAPSPTGLLHVGTARAALFNYLYARRHGGTFLLRLEDTDRARSTKEYERDILDGLDRLGLDNDGVTRQSERVELHTRELERLVKEDKAYVSREPAKDDPLREVEVVRLRNPGNSITFQDEIRGEVTFDTTELGDFVIARSLSDPLYHFAVVVDDADMGVTHVIRGEDHVSNTPRQILIQEALGLPRPVYAHLPLILAPDKSKLSKRKGAVSVDEYLQAGYYPETLVNFLALLGWNPGTEQEIFTLGELVAAFSLEHVQKGGAVFDIEKLKWMNREHRKRRAPATVAEDVYSALAAHPKLVGTLRSTPEALTDVLERFSTTGDLVEAVEAGEFTFYEAQPDVPADMLLWKKDPSKEATTRRLTKVHELLKEVTVWNSGSIEAALKAYAETEGKGNVLWPLRVALSGKDKSPNPYLLAAALGRDETLARIHTAVAVLA